MQLIHQPPELFLLNYK